MKRLTLSLLLGVFCLALLAVPTHAGQYDPSLPPPLPYINIPDGPHSSGDTGWEDPVKSLILDPPDGTTIGPSDAELTTQRTIKSMGQNQTGSLAEKLVRFVRDLTFNFAIMKP